ncbi:hypothetical protein AOLI_G00083320 [Acnodon oligacanthus]
MTLRRAEWHRRRRKERTRKRAAFITNPFGFTKQLLGKKRNGQLTCSKAEIERHLRDTFCDRSREQDLGHCQHLIDPPAPTLDFDGKEPSWKEIQEVIKKARSSSAPGPSGEEESKTIDQFRTISLLSVEGKIFVSIVARRLTDYLLRNSYIDTSVQKGGIPKVPGCLEHTGVVTQLIREARENKGDLVVLWLDLTNAYGSIPHKLVEEAMRRYHIPDKFRSTKKMFLPLLILAVLSLSGAMESGIVGGNEVEPHSRPYMVSLQLYNAHQCGGMLVKNNYVLTSAHCVDNIDCSQNNRLEVVLGAHNLKKHEIFQQRIKVMKCIKHPSYIQKEYHHDIMLLKLKTKAKINKFVKVIALPEENKMVSANQKCSIAGWGMKAPNTSASHVLQEMEKELFVRAIQGVLLFVTTNH